jgi:hypothetical protein
VQDGTTTHELLSPTCLVKLLTLFIPPKGEVSANSSSSGKCGGSPFMYTFGVFKEDDVFEFDVDSGMGVDDVDFEGVVGVGIRELTTTSWF